MLQIKQRDPDPERYTHENFSKVIPEKLQNLPQIEGFLVRRSGPISSRVGNGFTHGYGRSKSENNFYAPAAPVQRASRANVRITCSVA
jgi:hypothetical protein